MFYFCRILNDPLGGRGPPDLWILLRMLFSSKLLMHANSSCVVRIVGWKDACGKKGFRKFGSVATDHGNSREGNGTRTKADFLFCKSEFTYLLTQIGKREPAEKCSVTEQWKLGGHCSAGSFLYSSPGSVDPSPWKPLCGAIGVEAL